MTQPESHRGNNRILLLTLLTMVGIAVFMAYYSYQAQIDIFREKEMFKLDCIADAVSFKINGDHHRQLLEKYPNREDVDQLVQDSLYQMYRMMLAMTVEMKDISTQMYTLTYDSLNQDFRFGINSGNDPLWMEDYGEYPDLLRTNYQSGAMLDVHSDEKGSWISAFKPIKTMDGTTVAVLQVDETMETFKRRARSEVWAGLGLAIGIILIVGTLMLFSVKNIMRWQEKLSMERLEVENMRKELIANVSHDLRTPLASIHGYIETVLMKKDDLDDERMEKYLNTTLRSTEKLRNLVDELFELSKLETKERQLHAESLSITDLINDVVNNFKIEASEKNIIIQSHFTKNLSHARADIALIDRVLQNLIGNSMKYSNDGDAIEVKAEEKNGEIHISVSDTGEGIDSSELPFIFDRFRRGGTQKQGSGLGLAIVKGALDLHNSKYSIKSEKGKGTEFTFTLPIDRA